MNVAYINRDSESEELLQLKNFVNHMHKNHFFFGVNFGKYCDIIAFQIYDEGIFVIELGRNIRNLTRDVQYRLKGKCDKIIIITHGPALELGINKQIVRYVSSGLWKKISVTTKDKFDSEYVRRILFGEKSETSLQTEKTAA